MSDPAERTELVEDVMEELNKIGEVAECQFYDHHSEGAVRVKFDREQHAAECINIMHGRYFGGRTVTCHYWDPKTDHQLRQSSEDQESRLQQFSAWLQK